MLTISTQILHEWKAWFPYPHHLIPSFSSSPIKSWTSGFLVVSYPKDLLEFCAPGHPTAYESVAGRETETICTSPLLTYIILCLQSPSSHIKPMKHVKKVAAKHHTQKRSHLGHKFLCHVICPWRRHRLCWMVTANCFQVKWADNTTMWLSDPLKHDSDPV